MPIVTISDARGGALRWTGRADPQSVGTVRKLLVARAAELGADGDLRDRVALAVSEAMSNVVMHAYRDAPEPGEVTARLESRNATLEISILDRGVGLVPRADSPGHGRRPRAHGPQRPGHAHQDAARGRRRDPALLPPSRAHGARRARRLTTRRAGAPGAGMAASSRRWVVMGRTLSRPFDPLHALRHVLCVASGTPGAGTRNASARAPSPASPGAPG